MVEQSLVIVKPDGVARGLIGEVISRFEKKGLKLVAARFAIAEKEVAKEHYAEHKEKPFFGGLVDFITSGPVMMMIVEGNRAVESIRNLLGKTNGVESPAGTIRGDFGSSRVFNIVHASDSVASAKREIALWFKTEDLTSWQLPASQYLFEVNE